MVVVPRLGSNLIDRIQLRTFQNLLHAFERAIPPVPYVYLQDVVGFDSLKGIRENGPVIAGVLRGIGRPVILLTHRKGGLDALHALALEPALCERIAMWVSLRAPFGGSPVAGDPQGLPGRLREAMADLSSSTRDRYNASHRASHLDVTKRIPVRSCYTSYDLTSSIYPLDLLYVRMQEDGRPSDGLVPEHLTRLPGSAHVRLQDGHHADPVLPALSGQLWSTEDRIHLVLAQVDSAFVDCNQPMR